jgi:inhibitor of KinA sporulation pathway (predicted exonuclease)
MRIISVDLEMNQPSNKIIEIGAVAGNIVTGEITSIFDSCVSIDEQLDPRISKLTGITQEELDKSPPIHEVLPQFFAWARANKDNLNPMTWGGGDTQLLRLELEKLAAPNVAWPFGHRWIDVKTVYTAYLHSQGVMVTRSGLARSMVKLGLTFKGRKHRAVCDAYNTFVVYHRLLALMGKSDYKEPEAPLHILRPRGWVIDPLSKTPNANIGEQHVNSHESV